MSHEDFSIPVGSRPITKAPGYRICDGGVVWSSLLRGRGKGPAPWHIRKPFAATRTGHLQVGLRVDGRLWQPFVHHLVLWEFVGPCPPGMQARHYPDPDPTNNFVANLQWDTQTNNQADRVEHGTTNRGEQGGQAKLKDPDIYEIFRLAREGRSKVEIGKMFGVCDHTITDILYRKTWFHLPIETTSDDHFVTGQGDYHFRARLKAVDIPEIFRLAKQGLEQGEIAGRYGVASETINGVLRRRIWKHVEIDPDFLHVGSHPTGERHSQSKMTVAQIVDIFRLSHDGWSQDRIARTFGLSQSTVGSILNRKTWAHVEIPESLL
jgi:hypothetical protein